MDEAQARQLLGLDQGPLNATAIREARNAALKAHHPDVVGGDDAAARRATYWSAQINGAYQVLMDQASGGADGTRAGGPASRQSFAAAARRANERAASQRDAADREVRERAAAEVRAAEARATAAEQEREMREARARAETRAAAEAANRPAPKPRPALGTRIGGLRVRLAALAVGLVALAVITIAAVGRATPAEPWFARTATNPSAAPGSMQASVQPTPVSSPTKTTAKTTYDAWVAVYAAMVEPCYGSGPCQLTGQISYDDGTSASLDVAARSFAEYLRDTPDVLSGSDAWCREERANAYVLQASIVSEIDLLKALTTAERSAIRWHPVRDARPEVCVATPPDYPARESALRSLVQSARAELVAARDAQHASDWSSLSTHGQQLTALGMRIAQASDRDFEPGAGAAWAPIRQLGWDLIGLGGAVEVKRIASESATGASLTAAITGSDKALGMLAGD